MNKLVTQISAHLAAPDKVHHARALGEKLRVQPEEVGADQGAVAAADVDFSACE